MIVLSLFDGMSCGQIALSKNKKHISKYYASEIDKFAIKITQKNFPDTIQLGDIKDINGYNLPKIDLLMGGSPCQSFSTFGNGEGFNGKSGLFYEFVRLLKETKPKYFLLENVRMKKEWRDIITKELGVEPISFNSNLVSAQNRNRLYWTNIKFELPEDKGILLSDVLDHSLQFRPLPNFLKGKWGNKNRLDNGLNSMSNNKANCLTTKNAHTSQYLISVDRESCRQLSVGEYERIQTIPEDYTSGVSNTERFKMIGNGWTVDVISHILSHI